MHQKMLSLVDEFSTQKQMTLMQLKRGNLTKEQFLQQVQTYIAQKYAMEREKEEELLQSFSQYIFGYSIISPLIDDPDVSDIRILSFDRIRVKKKGKRMDAGIAFETEKEYRQFIDYVATKNQVNISNLNAIQRFTDSECHAEYILRFTLSMPLVNTYDAPYLCIRKVPRDFPEMNELIQRNMLSRELAELLVERFRSGSTLICGGNSSGKRNLVQLIT